MNPASSVHDTDLRHSPLPSMPLLSAAAAAAPVRRRKPRLSVELVSGERLRRNSWLQTELALIAAPSYDDASAILAREVAACTHLYIGVIWLKKEKAAFCDSI